MLPPRKAAATKAAYNRADTIVSTTVRNEEKPALGRDGSLNK
jgi:hypothetical protein